MPARKTNLADPIYHDDDAARAHLETLLWPQGPECPKCGVVNEATKLQGASTRPGVWKCRACRKPFSVTVGTVMERSHIPLHKWVLAAHFMAASKKGMSALQLQRMIGTNYETAWFLFHRLRECAITKHPGGSLGGKNKVVEADETYIGGKEKNKHKSKRKHLGTGGAGKAAVFSLVERDGKVRSFHVANVNSKTLRPILAKNVSRKSWIMTDDSPIYPKIADDFAGHGTVNHSADEYVRHGGFMHTNTVESYFAILKRGVYGTFHSVSEQHLPRYLAEFDFRHNHHKIADSERAEALLRGAKGKRLMYRQPD